MYSSLFLAMLGPLLAIQAVAMELAPCGGEARRAVAWEHREGLVRVSRALGHLPISDAPLFHLCYHWIEWWD